MLHIDPDCRKKLHTFFRLGLFERVALLTKKYQFFVLRVFQNDNTAMCFYALKLFYSENLKNEYIGRIY